MWEFALDHLASWMSVAVPSLMLGIWAFLYKKVFKPAIESVKEHQSMVKDISFIKNELTSNGGSSLKDKVICLDGTCKRIDASQKVVEHRSKIALNDHQCILFETDKDGRFTWGNKKFHSMMAGADPTGFSWLSIVSENDRATFVVELKSCLQMSRAIEFDTGCDETMIRIEGSPYLVTDQEHNGFLFNVVLDKRVLV